MAVELNGLSPTIVDALQTRSGGTAAGVRALDPATIAQHLNVDIEAVLSAQSMLAAVLERSTQAAEVVHGSVQTHLAATAATQGSVSHGGKRPTELPVAGVTWVDGGLVTHFEIDRPLTDKEQRQVSNGLELLSRQPKLLERLLGPGWRMTTGKPVQGPIETYFDAPHGSKISMREEREGLPRLLFRAKPSPATDGSGLMRTELTQPYSGPESGASPLAALAAQSPQSPPSPLTPTLSITSRTQGFVFEKLAPDGVSPVEQFRLQIQTQGVRHLAGDKNGTEATLHALYADGLGDATAMALQILKAVGIDPTRSSSKVKSAAGLGLLEP